MEQAKRQYLIEFLGALGVYFVLLMLSIWLLATHVQNDVLRVVVAVLPMLPCIGMCWVVLRALRRLDEMQRQIQLEALGFAFAGTAVISLTYGFLQNVGAPDITMFAVWPVMGVLWCLGLVLANRRYR